MLEGTWHGKTFNISAWSGFSFPRCVAGFINKPGFFISFLITVWELLIPNLICIGRIVTGGICLVLHIFSILNAFFFFFCKEVIHHFQQSLCEPFPCGPGGVPVVFTWILKQSKT